MVPGRGLVHNSGMQGSLSLSSGILYVGRHERTAHVRPYDLDGQPLARGFSFQGPDGGRASIAGLDVDDDHQVWIADGASSLIRTFNLFGSEVRTLAGYSDPRRDTRGVLRELSGVCVEPGERSRSIWVTSGGHRRHAVQIFDEQGGLLESLRPAGDPEGFFEGVRGVAVQGDRACVCEVRRGRVQVFRNRRFDFAFQIPVNDPAQANRGLSSPGGGAGGFRPVAAVPLPDGRIVVAQGGAQSALFVVDAAGRLLRVLAHTGVEPGCVFEPADVAVELSERDRTTRVVAIDLDAERVQVFTLEGRCYGSFQSLPGEAL